MGEDITKLKKNIEAIKTVIQGGKKNDEGEKGSSEKPTEGKSK